MVLETTVLLDGLAFPEGPRWRDGRLWFSDFFLHRVMTVDLDGNAETVVQVPGQPSGLGWLPSGRLLVVSMTDRRLLRLDPGGLAEVADLGKLASSDCNDMVVDRYGRAYIGHIGFDMYSTKWEPHWLAEIVLVTPDGDARIVADEMACPNGSVITPDGRTLIVAESMGDRLTAFAIGPGGSLTQRRIWPHLEKGIVPDGICLDAEGAIWVASPGSTQVLRVREGVEVTHRVMVATNPVACMLGGPDRRTLFVLMPAPDTSPDESRAMMSGHIEIVRVDVPGAGLP